VFFSVIRSETGRGTGLAYQCGAGLGKQGLFNMLRPLACSVETREPTPPRALGGGLAFDGGRLFATTGFRQRRGTRTRGGKCCGGSATACPIFDAPVANGGRVFVSTQDNHFHVLRREQRPRIWDPSRHQRIRTHPDKPTSRPVARRIRHRSYTSGELYALARTERTARLGATC